MDRPGTGLSDPLETAFPDFQSLVAFADTLVIDVLDAMGLQSAHLVATSYGGYFALRAAAAHSHRVRRMVEFGWTAGAPVARLPALMRVASVPAVGRVLAAAPVNERVVRAMFRRIGLRQALEAGRIPQEVLDCYVALLRYTDTMRNELTMSRWLMSPLRGLNDRIEQSTVRVFAIGRTVRDPGRRDGVPRRRKTLGATRSLVHRSLHAGARPR